MTRNQISYPNIPIHDVFSWSNTIERIKRKNTITLALHKNISYLLFLDIFRNMKTRILINAVDAKT